MLYKQTDGYCAVMKVGAPVVLYVSEDLKKKRHNRVEFFIFIFFKKGAFLFWFCHGDNDSFIMEIAMALATLNLKRATTAPEIIWGVRARIYFLDTHATYNILG